MHRPLARIPLRSIAESFSHLHHGRRIVAERLDYSRTLTISTGRDVLWNGAESTTMNLQIQIVKALKLGKRGEASNLLLSLGQGNDVKGADDFLHILKYCAMSPDPLFVMEAWTIMDEKEISLNSLCSALMVEALCNGGYLEEALKLINFLKQSHGIYPVLHVYNTFLKACTKMQSMVYANQCLELMERQKVGKNEVTYALLLKLAVWQQNLSVARELWKDYIKHYSLSIIPLQKFLLSFSKLGDLKSACKTLQYMVALVISGKASVNKSIKGKLYSSRLDIPIPLNCELGLKKLNLEENEQSVPSRYCENLDGHVVSADQCTSFGLGIGETKSVPADGFNIDISTPVMELLRCSFTNLIYACAELRNGGLAEQLVLQMQKLGFQINSHVYDGLIRAIVPERGFSSGMEIDQPENAVRLLAKMKHLQVTPNIWTYEQLFSLFGNVNAPYEEGNMLSQVDAAKRIKAIEMDMANYGIQHSFVSMNNLLKALGAEGMTRELIHYLHVAENLFCRNHIYLGTPIYNTVLHSLVESEESQMAIKMFKNMKSCGVPADAATYTIMIKCCKILRCYRSACALVSMMLRDGFYPLTITYTALIKTLLEDDIIDEALNLLDQASSEGNKLDTLVFNTILRKACEKELIDVVEFLVEWMHQEKIRPDSGTCSSVFTAYTNCGFYSTAMEALQVLSMRIICDEDGSCSEKTKFEDDYIFAEDEGAESRIILHFKDSKEDLAVALLNLRWCAVLGFPISWLPDQSPWAKRLSTNYTARIGAT
ncbi:pentatricopeptide repeat-containing protein At1g76280 isoform X3 [Rosa chinensis]|uniref:pentatricopeptide repeat-containing protein At1g76280 isoform X3 n=1 Tax=Rosa chinensis TaxID=74649 RepID=UPI001AD8C3EC|nr:pentatricopeptide repeat-containing protein At1g76280 isoform X3 [Rosa chinensis]